MQPRISGFALALLTFVLTRSALAEDWAQFLGPRQDATSAETGLFDRLTTNGIPEVWSRDVGTGYSAPVVLGSSLVLFHREKNEEVVEMLDAATGKSRWRQAYPSAYRDPYGYNNGPRCSPILTTNRIYTFGAEGKLTCLDAGNGKIRWQRDTSKDFTVPEAFFGVGSTPILEGGLLLVMVGGQTDSGVVAFDPETGATRWESVGKKNWEGLPMLGWPGDLKVQWREWEKTASYSSLRTATVHGERVLFACMRQGLVALNPTNGAVHFSRWFRARVDESVNAMTPVVVGEDVLISSAYYRSGSVLMRLGADNRSYTEVWKGLGMEMHWSQPVLHGGHLYGFSGRNEPDAVLRCVEWATGTVKWERAERWAPHSADQPPVFGRGSFILAEGRLIALGEGGLLGLFEPSPAGCRELGRWQVPTMKYPCWAGPILSSKRLYLRSENRLICLNAGK